MFDFRGYARAILSRKWYIASGVAEAAASAAMFHGLDALSGVIIGGAFAVYHVIQAIDDNSTPGRGKTLPVGSQLRLQA